MFFFKFVFWIYFETMPGPTRPGSQCDSPNWPHTLLMRHISPSNHRSGQAPPSSASNCQFHPQITLTALTNCWTLSPPYRVKSPPISALESSTLESSTPSQETLCKLFTLLVCRCFWPEQRQPPSWLLPLPVNLLCGVCCAVCLCGILWLPTGCQETFSIWAIMLTFLDPEPAAGITSALNHTLLEFLS